MSQLEGASFEDVVAVPMWDMTSLAVGAIVNWLRTGDSVRASVQSRIDSLGSAVAVQQVVSTSVELDHSTPASSRYRGPARSAVEQLSVALLTKLNFWWSDKTCEVLEEEAARLGISQETLDEARTGVVKSCQASLVRMGKQYDAEMASLHRELSHLALHDPLTGLSNRSLLNDRLDGALARLSRHPVGLALAYLDLDNFKVVNDIHGHRIGDDVLKVMAARMIDLVRPEDLVARLGGDEFVVLFEDLSDPIEDAQVLGERLRAVVSEPMEIDGEVFSMTASIGIGIVQVPGVQSEALLSQSDAAMYTVKRAGRDRVATVEVGNGMHPVRFAMASGLHHALERKEFRLAYQAIHCTKDRSIVGFEALLRWEHPERGTISPLEFIPVAEESGLMVPIGAWVVEEACRQAMEWRMSGGIGPEMAVNVSGRQLSDPSFVGHVSAVLSAVDMKPEHLVLEITESVLLADRSDAETVLADLKALGVRLSIDDFGTGYSSLAYLRRLPVDQLKVDRSFVQDVASHGDTRIMEAVVRLAHDLGLEVVAEGVETSAELEIVSALGCDLVQGFLLGHPSPSSDIQWVPNAVRLETSPPVFVG